MPCDTVTIPGCTVVRESDKALLIKCESWTEDKWIPKSQIDDDSDVFEAGTEGDLVVSRWIAEQKELA